MTKEELKTLHNQSLQILRDELIAMQGDICSEFSNYKTCEECSVSELCYKYACAIDSIDRASNFLLKSLKD